MWYYTILALAMWSSLLRSDGHLSPSDRHLRVTSRWPRSLGSDVTSCDVIWKILKIIFLLYFCNLGNFTSFWHHSSIFIFFIKWRHLKWLADGHVIRSDVTSQVTSIKIQVTVISSSDEQMARAILSSHTIQFDTISYQEPNGITWHPNTKLLLHTITKYTHIHM